MALTRRVHVSMEAKEFRRLQILARRRGTTVANLIRSAVRDAYPAVGPELPPIVDAILALQLDLPDWTDLREELGRGHAGIP